MITLLDAAPFDGDRSPWDITLFHPLEEGKSAVYVRAHHVLTDGVGGVRLLQVFFDTEGPFLPAPESSGGHPDHNGAASDDAGSSRWPTTVTIDFAKAYRSASDRIGAARDTQPVNTFVRGFQRALDLANSVSRQVMVTGGPLAPLPPSHSVFSHFDVLSVPNARDAAIALGGSRNDLLVVAAAAALGLYAERVGETCTSVRVGMPARQRRDGALGGNWFAPTRVEVPTSATHPDRQFSVVGERLAQARHEPALRITDAVVSAISLLPNRVLLPALQTQADAVDLAVTAIPGLRGQRQLCGVTVDAIYPIGPRLGVPLNVTGFANGSGLDIGISLDSSSITVPDGFHECLVEAFRRLGSPVTPADG
jgi:hypothetical protein